MYIFLHCLSFYKIDVTFTISENFTSGYYSDINLFPARGLTTSPLIPFQPRWTAICYPLKA